MGGICNDFNDDFYDDLFDVSQRQYGNVEMFPHNNEVQVDAYEPTANIGVLTKQQFGGAIFT